MSTRKFYVDSIASLNNVEESLEDIKGKVIINITGCNPPGHAQQLLHTAIALRGKRGLGSTKLKGLDVLRAIQEEAAEKAAELGAVKAQLEETASDTPYLLDPQAHTRNYQHTTNYYTMNESLHNMDVDALQQLDREVVGTIKRYEHHRAMEGDATRVAGEDWLPRVNEELAKYRPRPYSWFGSGSGP